jgi:hypothetical protein
MRVKGDARGSYTARRDARGRYTATDTTWNRMRVCVRERNEGQAKRLERMKE